MKLVAQKQGLLVWQGAPDLFGSIHWGALDANLARDDDLAARLAAFADGLPRVKVLHDLRAVGRVDGDALTELVELARARTPRTFARVELQVVVVPRGVAGLLLTGALVSLPTGQRVQVVHELDTGLAHLAHPDAPAAHAEAQARAAEASAVAPLVARLRAVLTCDLERVSVTACAAALGQSARSLQRHLALAGTSFSEVLLQARLDAACELLEHTDGKIEAIAARTGFGSASRLSAFLRREHALTASEVRARAREPLARAS